MAHMKTVASATLSQDSPENPERPAMIELEVEPAGVLHICTHAWTPD
jgi:hypothetical protein